MWQTQLVILATAALAVASTGLAESTVQARHVLVTYMAVETPSLGPGGFNWTSRLFIFPSACRYIAHDVELLDHVPQLGPLDYPKIRDGLRKAHPESKLADRLSVMIAAYRPMSLPRGPAAIKVKVKIIVECEEGALAKLISESGLEEIFGQE
jgi:hypothetical protein